MIKILSRKYWNPRWRRIRTGWKEIHTPTRDLHAWTLLHSHRMESMELMKVVKTNEGAASAPIVEGLNHKHLLENHQINQK